MQQSTSKLAWGRVPGPWVNAAALEPRCYEKRKDRTGSRSGFCLFLWGAPAVRCVGRVGRGQCLRLTATGKGFLGLEEQSCNYRGPFGGEKERKNMEGA